jgi:hypothetical protein
MKLVWDSKNAEVHIYRRMITFKEFVKKTYGEENVGIYPPLYGNIGNLPPQANQTGPDQVYVKASRNSLKKRRKKKKRGRKR